MPHKRAKQSTRLADRKSKGSDLPPRAIEADLRDMPKNAMRIINAAQVQEEYNRKKKERQALERSKIERGKGKGDGDKEKEELRIRPGEKLSDFSRRVETSMASEVHATFRATRDSHNKKRKRKGQDDQAESAATVGETRKAREEPNKQDLRQERERIQQQASSSSTTTGGQDLDWQKASQRRRVNDVVQAPPSLTKAPRGQSAAALTRKEELKTLMSGEQRGGEGAQAKKSKARLPDGIARIMGMRYVAELEEAREEAVKEYRRIKERKLLERNEQSQ